MLSLHTYQSVYRLAHELLNATTDGTLVKVSDWQLMSCCLHYPMIGCLVTTLRWNYLHTSVQRSASL